jgi:single-strand DNA-binding protein
MKMASFQKYICMGNLTRDPDYRTTPSGTGVCEFTVAVNSARREDGAFFGQVVAFGKTADACRQYLMKGSTVLVEGKLKNDEWEDRQTGQKRTKTRIVADTVQFIDQSNNSRQNAQSGANTGYQAGRRPYGADDCPTPPMPGE